MEEARTELEIMKREISNYFETDTSKEEEHEWINQFVENH